MGGHAPRAALPLGSLAGIGLLSSARLPAGPSLHAPSIAWSVTVFWRPPVQATSAAEPARRSLCFQPHVPVPAPHGAQEKFLPVTPNGSSPPTPPVASHRGEKRTAAGGLAEVEAVHAMPRHYFPCHAHTHECAVV